MTQYSIVSDFSNVSILAEQFTEFCQQNHIVTDVISRLELALVESVNNIIEHAYKDQSGMIDASFLVTSKELVITLVDQGKPPSGTALLDTSPLPDINLLPEGGWGLGLIQTLTDHFEVSQNQGVNTTKLTKYLSEDDRVQ
ncbi:MAG: ATP-binding protein [Thiotrichaceae bacterium]|nr:ATP-binding protein [Thiotrichaceae bacterium]